MQHTEACDDCVVTFICGREPGQAVGIDVGEARAGPGGGGSSGGGGGCRPPGTPVAGGGGREGGKMGAVPAAAYVDERRPRGRAAGLDAVGVASAEPFSAARRALIERKAAGL